MAILLLDDNEMDLFIHSKLIQNANIQYETRKFTDPSDAIDHIKKNGDLKAVIVDNQMPGYNGFDVLSAVEGFLDSIEVVAVLSASFHPEDVKKFKKLSGKIHFWEKPLDAEKLKQVIQ